MPMMAPRIKQELPSTEDASSSSDATSCTSSDTTTTDSSSDGIADDTNEEAVISLLADCFALKMSASRLSKKRTHSDMAKSSTILPFTRGDASAAWRSQSLPPPAPKRRTPPWKEVQFGTSVFGNVIDIIYDSAYTRISADKLLIQLKLANRLPKKACFGAPFNVNYHGYSVVLTGADRADLLRNGYSFTWIDL